MVILIVANKGSNHAKKVAGGLAERGHDVVFASPNDVVDKSVILDPRIKLVTLPYGGKFGYISNSFALRTLYNKVKPDVVNVHYASGCGMLAMLSGVKPKVLSCYGSDIFEFPRLNKFNNWLLKRILKNADALASTSHAMADEIKNLLPGYEKEIAITPFGVDTEMFKPYPRETSNSPLVVGIVKTLSPIYDIELLLRAFAIICQSMTSLPVLRIFGDGPSKSHLIQLAADLNISDHVEFRGRVSNENVPMELNQMDVFVNCSRQESFGVNVLEAMACGLPVVATDCVGPRELILDGKSGIIVKDRKPESLATEIIKLLKDPKLRDSMGSAGRERVCDSYDWNKNVFDLERVLDNNKKVI